MEVKVTILAVYKFRLLLCHHRMLFLTKYAKPELRVCLFFNHGRGFRDDAWAISVSVAFNQDYLMFSHLRSKVTLQVQYSRETVRSTSLSWYYWMSDEESFNRSPCSTPATFKLSSSICGSWLKTSQFQLWRTQWMKRCLSLGWFSVHSCSVSGKHGRCCWKRL